MLTAAHCIRGLRDEDVGVGLLVSGRVERGISALQVIRHPTADAAIIRISDIMPIFDFFVGFSAKYAWGDNVTAFGYPEDTTPEGMEPTPRYFRGHIQRMFRHESQTGFTSDALELSFGAPGGLSGGPVALERDPSRAIGIVAENVRSSTFLETVLDVQDGAERYREQIHSVINYSVCVRLDRIRDWLNQHVPQRPRSAAHRST